MDEEEAIKKIQSWYFEYQEKKDQASFVAPTYLDKDGNLQFDYEKKENDLSEFNLSKEGKLYSKSIEFLFNLYYPLVCNQLFYDEKINPLTKINFNETNKFKSSEIEEIASDMLLNILYIKIFKYRQGSFRAWLKEVIHNDVIDKIKKEKIPKRKTELSKLEKNFYKDLGSSMAIEEINRENSFKLVLEKLKQLPYLLENWNAVISLVSEGISVKTKNNNIKTKKIITELENYISSNWKPKPPINNRERFIKLSDDEWKQISEVVGDTKSDGDKRESFSRCVNEALERFEKHGYKEHSFALSLTSRGYKHREISEQLKLVYPDSKPKSLEAIKKFLQSSKEKFQKYSKNCLEILFDTNE